MSVQDKLERTLREIHIIISRGQAYEEAGDCVIVNKKDMLRQLTNLNLAVSQMMDAYETTKQSRDRGEREAVKNRETIVRDANHQAEDIYAASVLYTDDALGRIQDIIEEAGKSSSVVLEKLNKDMEQEKRIVRSNQMELKSQLEDLKDTAKYLRIIEERNKETAKAKRDAKSRETEPDMKNREKNRTEKNRTEKDSIKEEGTQEESASEESTEKNHQESEFISVNAKVRVNEEYFRHEGLTPEGVPVEKQEISYSKPEIRVNEEYFKKAGITLENKQRDETEHLISNQETLPEETEEVIDSKTEALLKEDLDLEYFEWRDGNGIKKEKKTRGEWRFPFGH